MRENTIKTPFFIFNPKSNLYGKKLMELVEKAEELAKEYPISIFVTAPYSDLNHIAEKTNNIIVTAQHMDSIAPGGGMGHILPEALYNIGVRATFLNHAENPMTLAKLSITIERARKVGIISIVCADSIREAQAICMLNPDIILCEPTDLIGTGKTSEDSYIIKTKESINNINSRILVMQAAGISNPDDVTKVISLGADGTGCTSGIINSDNPKNMLEDMVKAVVKASC